MSEVPLSCSKKLQPTNFSLLTYSLFFEGVNWLMQSQFLAPVELFFLAVERMQFLIPLDFFDLQFCARGLSRPHFVFRKEFSTIVEAERLCTVHIMKVRSLECVFP